MNRTIAILGGTGDQGFGLALRWAKAGDKVIIGSRQQQKATDAVNRLKEIIGNDVNVEGMENPVASASSDIVVLAVPMAAQINILESVKDNLKEGTIFVDLTVPLATAIGDKPTRTLSVWSGSAVEQAARILPRNVQIVSAFNNLSADALQDVNSQVDCDVIICGNNNEAKKVIMDLTRKIPGARPIDGGPLENARLVEQITALLIGLNIRYKSTKAGIRITGIDIK